MQTLENAMRRVMLEFTNNELAKEDLPLLPEDADSDTILAAQLHVEMLREAQFIKWLVSEPGPINTRGVRFATWCKENP